ncbi:hypothetical protein [Streptomyces sp. NPDC051684]|uniref:hypothetical protein n=1 Tax=Streptomyces sp. NPDC051684 TaxID=3365670 RepID=UPI0037A53113
MLEIERERVFGRTYRIRSEGAPVGRWNAQTWKSGGRVELAGEIFELRSSRWGRSFEMLEGGPGGPVRAQAHRSGRRWHITDAEDEYELIRPSALRGKRRLVKGVSILGELRLGRFGSGLTADLADVPLSLQVFAGLVVISVQQRQARAAAASSG